MFFLHKWKKNLESDIDCMEESMQPYIALFYAFRKIRHDFANYVQTLQLFAEVENYDEKKKMKKGILDQIGRFYECMPDTVPLFPPMPAKATRNTQLGLLYETWSEIRREMEKLPDTIKKMLEPLQKLQDQMERSLNPDESETEALLSGLDQFRSLPTEETSALSVLMDLCMQEAEQNSCLLRYKICQPTCFQMAYPDKLLLYRQLFLLALSGAGQSGGKTDMSSAVIRLRSAEKFDMWHLHLEFPYTPDGQDSLLQMQKTQMYRCIRKLSKTYKLQLKFARISDGISLDLVK
jgi:hypothetical protein